MDWNLNGRGLHRSFHYAFCLFVYVATVGPYPSLDGLVLVLVCFVMARFRCEVGL